MSDIITADNLPLIIGAIGTAAAGLSVWRWGGKLGDGAKGQAPPQADVTVAGGLIMSSTGSQAMVDALQDIAAAVRESTEAFRTARSDKLTSSVEKMHEAIAKLAAHEENAPAPKPGPRRG